MGKGKKHKAKKNLAALKEEAAGPSQTVQAGTSQSTQANPLPKRQEVSFEHGQKSGKEEFPGLPAGRGETPRFPAGRGETSRFPAGRGETSRFPAGRGKPSDFPAERGETIKASEKHGQGTSLISQTHVAQQQSQTRQEQIQEQGFRERRTERHGQAMSPTQQQSQVKQAPVTPPTSTDVTQVSHGSSKVSQEKALNVRPIYLPKSTISSDGVNYTLPGPVATQYMEQLPRRKYPYKCGTLGKPITVEVNVVTINFSPSFKTNAVHYDVKFVPVVPRRLMVQVFERFRSENFPNRYPAYDGKFNAVSAGDLPFGDHITKDVTIFNEERKKNVTIKIELKKVQTVDLSWLKTRGPYITLEKNQIGVQILDIILRSGPLSRSIVVGKSFFPPQQPDRIVSLSGGLDLWLGTFQSAIIGWKPYLNIDVANKGFPSAQNVVDLMKQFGFSCDGEQSGQRQQYSRTEQLTKFLKGLKVHYEIPGQCGSKRVHRVNDLVEPANVNKFSLDDGNTITVKEYYYHQKKYTIRYPNLPCLWVGPKDKRICLPAELCTVVAGQAVRKQLSTVQTSKMIRETAINTTDRKRKILEGFAAMQINDNPTMSREFNLSVSGQFERVPARVLDPPSLMYDKSINVRKGKWEVGKFVRPSMLKDGSWTILNLDPNVKDRELYNLEKQVQDAGPVVGMVIGKAKTPFTSITVQRRDIRGILNYFKEKKKEEIKLVVVVIPERIENAYSQVKQITELNVGLMTQCIKTSTLREKFRHQTVINILLKINSKMDGINHTFVDDIRPKCLMSRVMLLGADVTHPSPDAIDIPSIAAVAASYDSHAFQYHIEMRLQPPRMEIIQNFGEIMHKQLMFYQQEMKKLPQSIIFYRDGVSEGQLPHVMHFELMAMKRAITAVYRDLPKPQITVLVVQKRHHIRFFPTDHRFSDDKNFNVQAGTIVDTEITHPSNIDFYLVSHASIQGTAKPTKYRCVLNEINLTEDEIEELTYYLCHMFARCTRSVSYPAPTYYAHLAAFRARVLTQGVPIVMSRLAEEQREKLTVVMNSKQSMFFV